MAVVHAAIINLPLIPIQGGYAYRYRPIVDTRTHTRTNLRRVRAQAFAALLPDPVRVQRRQPAGCRRADVCEHGQRNVKAGVAAAAGAGPGSIFQDKE